jgi:hypothetical protein
MGQRELRAFILNANLLNGNIPSVIGDMTSLTTL